MRFLQSTDPTTGVTTWFEFGHADRLECHALAQMPDDSGSHLYAVTLIGVANVIDYATEDAARVKASADIVRTLDFIRERGMDAYEAEITRAGQKGIVLIGARTA